MGFEKNVVGSFRKVKDEMDNLQHQVFELKQKLEDVEKVLLKKEKKGVKRTVRKK